MPEGYLGAFTDDPDDLDVAQRFCKTLADEGITLMSADALLSRSVPPPVGGTGPTPP